MTHDYHDNHRTLEKLVEREVGFCVSTLMSDLFRIVPELPYNIQRDLSFDYEDDLMPLASKPASNEDAAFENGWRVTEIDGEWYYHEYKYVPLSKDFPKGYGIEHQEDADVPGYCTSSGDMYDTEEEAIKAEWLDFLPSGESYEEDAWDACVNDEGVDTHSYDSDVYEHWVVTNFFARKLKDQGEVVREVGGLQVWGRCTTGQSISCDGVIMRIAESMEILKGQKYEWNET